MKSQMKECSYSFLLAGLSAKRGTVYELNASFVCLEARHLQGLFAQMPRVTVSGKCDWTIFELRNNM
jgi:hypothetical protein